MKDQDISGKVKCKSNWFEDILTWNAFWNTTEIMSTQNSFRMAEVFYGNKQDRMKLMSFVSNDTLPWRKRHQFKLMRQIKARAFFWWCMFYDKLCIMLCYRSVGWSYFPASLCHLVDFLYSRTMKSFSLHAWRMFYDKLCIMLSAFDDDRYTI